jgi:hypothetical protein
LKASVFSASLRFESSITRGQVECERKTLRAFNKRGHAFAWGMSDTDWVHPNLRVVLLYVGRRQQSTEVADSRLPMWKVELFVRSF